uniref:uncharacterized protein LOC122607541 n=1 Tax=Erigeron canadensis TaxID=72917 RepID=UPI001CB88DD3|nr:uncharacterized protein LOC122607541 [Erigeron canadensis]
MSTYDPQETDILHAFQKWKGKWKKQYPSTEEEKARFQDFKNNVLHQPFIPASDPLWDLLNDHADKPRTDNFNYIRLDFCMLDESSDDDLPNDVFFTVPEEKEDGTIGPRYVTPAEFRCHWEKKKMMLLSNTKVPCCLSNALVMTKMIPKTRIRITVPPNAEI